MTNGRDENPYLLLGFWELAILATLMIAFFPWSLLFCLAVYGMEDTKLVVVALLHDFFKTVLPVAAVVFSVAFFLVLLAVVVLAVLAPA